MFDIKTVLLCSALADFKTFLLCFLESFRRLSIFYMSFLLLFLSWQLGCAPRFLYLLGFGSFLCDTLGGPYWPFRFFCFAFPPGCVCTFIKFHFVASQPIVCRPALVPCDFSADFSTMHFHQRAQFPGRSLSVCRCQQSGHTGDTSWTKESDSYSEHAQLWDTRDTAVIDPAQA